MGFHPKAIAAVLAVATVYNVDAFAPASVPAARQQLTRINIATGIPSADIMSGLGGGNEGDKDPKRSGALIDLDGIKFSVRVANIHVVLRDFLLEAPVFL